jgi:hypothetical protein
MDDVQFNELKALLLPISNWVAVQTGQAAPPLTTRAILAQQASVVVPVSAGPLNPAPYRTYRMNVPALDDGVDPDGEPIWQVIGAKGVPTDVPMTHADADAAVARLNGADAPGAVGVVAAGPGNPPPYAAQWSVSNLWYVAGATGVSTGFSGHTEPEARSEADRLNGAAPVGVPTPVAEFSTD